MLKSLNTDKSQLLINNNNNNNEEKEDGEGAINKWLYGLEELSCFQLTKISKRIRTKL